MIGLLEVVSERKGCKSCNKGYCEMPLQFIEGILNIGDIDDLVVGDSLIVLGIHDKLMTTPIESIRKIDDVTLEFITKTVSYRLTIKE